MSHRPIPQWTLFSTCPKSSCLDPHSQRLLVVKTCRMHFVMREKCQCFWQTGGGGWGRHLSTVTVWRLKWLKGHRDVLLTLTAWCPEVSSVCRVSSGALGFDSHWFREGYHLFQAEVSRSVTLLIFDKRKDSPWWPRYTFLFLHEHFLWSIWLIHHYTHTKQSTTR
jgi:hypothetical protein